MYSSVAASLMFFYYHVSIAIDVFDWSLQAYRNQLLENRLEVSNKTIVEWVDGFFTSEFPASLPQDLDRALVWVDGVELVAQDPAHFEWLYSMIMLVSNDLDTHVVLNTSILPISPHAGRSFSALQ